MRSMGPVAGNNDGLAGSESDFLVFEVEHQLSFHDEGQLLRLVLMDGKRRSRLVRVEDELEPLSDAGELRSRLRASSAARLIFSTISSMCPSLMMNGGASSAWSPRMPSALPPPW